MTTSRSEVLPGRNLQTVGIWAAKTRHHIPTPKSHVILADAVHPVTYRVARIGLPESGEGETKPSDLG